MFFRECNRFRPIPICKGGDLSVPEATAKHFMLQLEGLEWARAARSSQPRGLAETLFGSPLYMAPEIMQLHKYDAKADLWTVGAILSQLVTGRTPFTGNSQIQIKMQALLKQQGLWAPLSKDSKGKGDAAEMAVMEEKAHSTIMLCLEDEVILEVSGETTAANMWKKLETLYMTKSLQNKLLLKRRLFALRMQEGTPLKDHLDQLNSVLLELRNIDVKVEDEDAALLLLVSLPLSYENFVESFIVNKVTVTLEEVRSALHSRVLRHQAAGTVERLTFEEFFGHPFLSERQSYELSRSRLGSRAMDDFLSSGSSPSRNMEESSQDDCLPFLLDDDSSGPEGSPSHLKRTSSMRSSSGFNIDARVERKETGSSPLQLDDSQDSMDQDYVLVSGPPVDLPSSSSSSSKAYNFPWVSRFSRFHGSSQNSAPSTSHGSLDLGDAFEQPSTNSLTRISSLKKCAATIAELVHERIKSDKHLEAFSIQLAILAIWKQALHICHTQAISGLEGSPSQDINKLRGSSSRKHERITDISHDGLEEISSQIQRQFIRETEILINLAVGNTMMPDAMETIFEAALDLGKLGGVKEVMGDIENAGNQYSKAVRLLVFLLVEAPMLILNPPLSLTNSDRYRSEHISIS
ncbi:unnamed protein product [Arabidopsis arenosa]|uniref:Protein kinase domain-containing protein n=1 Tax=Arabidopsis arenosa TaxID=38785 RepID=A0A8S2AZZ5_ARAAE|nr:unnamed protein product [Arabidopsis arenosa]